MIAAEQLAALANLTKRRLYQLAEEGKIPPATNGQFPMLASIKALFNFYQRDGEEIQKEKLKKLTAERQRLELKLSKEQGRLVETDEAVRQSAEAMAVVFSDMTRDANELPPACAGRSAVEVGTILSARIEKHRRDWTAKFEAIGK